MIGSKKGAVLTAKALGGIILAAVVLFSSFYLFGQMFGVFQGAGDKSMPNFISISGKVQQMVNSPETLMTEEFPYYISKDYILVGFSSDWNDEEPVNVVNGDHPNIPKPAVPECYSDNACLCIYKERRGDDFDDEDETPEKCVSFGPGVYFSGADGYEQYYGKSETEEDYNQDSREKRLEFTLDIIQSQSNIPALVTGAIEQITGPNGEDSEGTVGADVAEEAGEEIGSRIAEEAGTEEEIDYSPEWHYTYIANSCIPYGQGEIALNKIVDEEEKDGPEGQGEIALNKIVEEKYKDGAIDGFPYEAIKDKFSFQNLYPLNHEYMVLYGEGEHAGCRKSPKSGEDEDYCIDICKDEEEKDGFGSRILYLEKYVEEGKTHILIAPYEGFIVAREQSASDILLDQIRQQSRYGRCPVSYGTYDWAQVEAIEEEYKDTVSQIIENSEYKIEPELVYAMIYTNGNDPEYESMALNTATGELEGTYGLLQIRASQAYEICPVLLQPSEEEPEGSIYELPEEKKQLLMQPSNNLDCGIKILSNYSDLLTKSQLSTSNENILAGFIGGSPAIESTGREEDGKPILKWKHEEGPVYNNVTEILDYYSCYVPYYYAPEGQCFPVAKDSLDFIQWNFGNLRSNGDRCHAGIDVFTKGQGDIIAVSDGEVISRYHFTDVCDKSVDAVIIDHGEYVINYGEIDSDSKVVAVGDEVKAGQVIGKATGCGMLHFELYEKGTNSNQRWRPPEGEKVLQEPNYCRENYLSTKPPELNDPTEFLAGLESSMCG